MGIAPFQVTSSLHMVVAQRLVRRLCVHCKKPSAESPVVYQAHGCPMCDAGYKGRVGIYQVMPISDAISRLIMNNGTVHDIADQAKLEGVKDLRLAGLEKVKQGLTSIAEIESCTNE